MVARPQTLMVTLLGRHVHERGRIAVSAQTFIEVLERLEVAEGTARSTLTRMVRRGFLERHRIGRESYFALTEWTQRLLKEGRDRIYESPVAEDHDGEWTLLSFSIPESQRGDRHLLRRSLAWRGFGRLRNGLWIAPGRVPVADMIADQGLSDCTDVFLARAKPPSDVMRIVSECWDLDRLSASYEAFLDRWADAGPPHGTSPLAYEVQLVTDWRLVLLEDPKLPVTLLPESWPAMAAFELFTQRLEAVRNDARNEFEHLLRSVDATG